MCLFEDPRRARLAFLSLLCDALLRRGARAIHAWARISGKLTRAWPVMLMLSPSLAGAQAAPIQPDTAPTREYTVKEGDTLGKVAEQELGSKDAWPRLWSRNPEVTNPHWIYPGMRLRVESPGVPAQATQTSSLRPPPGKVSQRRGAIGAGYVSVLGFVRSDGQETAGRLVGAPNERTMLVDGDVVYIHFEGAPAPDGSELAIFRRFELGKPNALEDRGELVRIFGRVRVLQSFNGNKLARGLIVESNGPLERGFAVAAIEERFVHLEGVPAVRADEGLILGDVRDREAIAAGELVVIQPAERAHLPVGTLLEIVRSGDPWHDELGVSHLVSPHSIEPPSAPPSGLYPTERVGTAIVVDSGPDKLTAFVIESITELQKGDRIRGLTAGGSAR